MRLSISLEKMSVGEKLHVLELIWDDLCRNPEEIPSPSWHEDVLKARERRIRQGAAKFLDWQEAKGQIRDQVK